MDTTGELAQAWALDGGLPSDIVAGLSDADWSALLLRLIQGLPSSAAEDDQALRLDALRRLIGLRRPLPDQPALIAMRQRFQVTFTSGTTPGGNTLFRVLDALTAQPPAPPARIPERQRSEGEDSSPSRQRRKADGRQGRQDLSQQQVVEMPGRPRHADRFGGDFLQALPGHVGNVPGDFISSIAPSENTDATHSATRVHPGRKPTGNAAGSKRRPRHWLANIERPDRDVPLEIGADCVVSFDVGTLDQPHLAAGQYDSTLSIRSAGILDLTVQVSSDDFDIRSNPIQSLEVPRQGRTPSPARFLVGARRAGPCTLTATVHRRGNFVTLLHFTVWAAKAGDTTLTVVGRPPDGLVNLEPRDISLTLERSARNAGYDCHIVADGSAKPPAYLAITPEGLAKEVDALQKALMEVVKTVDEDGREVFQAGIQIPEAHERAALRTLAHAGARLFREIFSGDSSDYYSQRLGSYLRDAANDVDSMLTLQVVDNEAPIPWALLYVGDVDDGARLEWDKFLGLRHLIEQLPLGDLDEIKIPKALASDPKLTVGLNVNLMVDKRLVREVEDHQARWSSMVSRRTRLEVTTRNTSKEVIAALANRKNGEKIVYFYCHATSEGYDGDTGKATITMEPNVRLTLEDLKRNAGRNIKFAGHPLVFINACESADLTPLFYTGFVPYFMSKGARGVIGTQCKTPALLAMKCAELFFDHLLDGKPVGASMLETRRELLDVYRNPLGLLYAVHCDVDTLIAPPLPINAP